MDFRASVAVPWDDGLRDEGSKLYDRWMGDESKLWLFLHGRVGDKLFRQFGWTSEEPRRRELRYVAVLDSDAVSSAHCGARKVVVKEAQEVAFELAGKRPCVRLSVSRTFAAAEAGPRARFRGTETWRFLIKPGIARVASRLQTRGATGKVVQQRVISVQVTVPESVEVDGVEGEEGAGGGGGEGGQRGERGDGEGGRRQDGGKAEGGAEGGGEAGGGRGRGGGGGESGHGEVGATALRAIATFWGRRAQRRLELVAAYERFCALTASQAKNGSGKGFAAAATATALSWKELLPGNATKGDYIAAVAELYSDLSLTRERLRLAEDLLDRARERKRIDTERLALVKAERDGYRKAVDFARNYIETEDAERAGGEGGGSSAAARQQRQDWHAQWRPALSAPPRDRDLRWGAAYGENELYYDLP